MRYSREKSSRRGQRLEGSGKKKRLGKETTAKPRKGLRGVLNKKKSRAQDLVAEWLMSRKKRLKRQKKADGNISQQKKEGKIEMIGWRRIKGKTRETIPGGG